MDSWKPIEEHEILDLINKGCRNMSFPQRRLWETIRIDPVKWHSDSKWDDGSGFWVVAIFGQRVIWYNEIEEGFNTSTYDEFGKIRDFGYNQDELEWTVGHLLHEIKGGNPTGKADDWPT